VVHYTAGVADSTGVELIKAKEDGYVFIVIGADGTVFQAHPMDEWGDHCGPSEWHGLGKWLSNDLVGIELACPGKLIQGRTWFGVLAPADKIRVVAGKDNVDAGAYWTYTAEQEATLVSVLRWLHAQGRGIFSYDAVLGHDEISPKRKQDPGGSLSRTMPEFRTYLKSLI
jgi:N-acetyl-anhydromuramyl-L-alanine amidase AmpD